MNATPTASNKPDVFPSKARAVLLAGMAGFFFANFTSQFLVTHFGVQTGAALSATEVSWMSAAYTLATFMGMVSAEPLEKRLGLRRYFVGSALLLAAFGWLQATTPSEPLLFAVRTFEGFTTGGFGPRALLATFMLYRGSNLSGALALSVFLLLVAGLIGLVMFGASESVLGWQGMFFLQFALSLALVLAGIRWLPPKVTPKHAPTVALNSVAAFPAPPKEASPQARHRRHAYRVASMRPPAGVNSSELDPRWPLRRTLA
jgi:MFS family permease